MFCLRLCLLLGLCLLPLGLAAQIETRGLPAVEPLQRLQAGITAEPYDSLHNLPGRNLGGLVGQRLFMNKRRRDPFSTEFAQSTYPGFYTQIAPGQKRVYQGLQQDGYSRPLTRIEAVYGQYFRVEGYELVYAYPNNKSVCDLYLQLRDKRGELLYFRYLEGLNSWTAFRPDQVHFPFITEGFYRKAFDKGIALPL